MFSQSEWWDEEAQKIFYLSKETDNIFLSVPEYVQTSRMANLLLALNIND